jgi:hypothetical protein
MQTWALGIFRACQGVFYLLKFAPHLRAGHHMAFRQGLIRLQDALAWAGRRWGLILLLVVFLLGLAGEGPSPGALDAQVSRSLAGRQFDFVGWEVEALLGKLLHGLIAPQRAMDEEARHDFFLDYLELVAEIEWTDREIEKIYVDPAVEDPDAASAELRARMAELRAEQRSRQPLAEAILQEQVAAILVDEGFGVLRQEFPPVSAHFTPLPTLIVISPRDRIENILSLPLEHGLNTADKEAIEERIDADFDVSSLVTDIGGLAAYPSMLLESSWIVWVAEVTSHEWTHHYLTLRPLGWNYLAAPETRTINETVASIVGKEVGRRVIIRYYPEFIKYLPPEPAPEPELPEEMEEAGPPPEPPAFDFGLEMRKTRIHADELLAAGKIEEAEAYMEAQRRVFVAQGINIRKLNQAYFAFYGSYADTAGAAGKDPIGPAVLRLWARSPDLYTFVSRVAKITTLDELEGLLAE